MVQVHVGPHQNPPAQAGGFPSYTEVPQGFSCSCQVASSDEGWRPLLWTEVDSVGRRWGANGAPRSNACWLNPMTNLFGKGFREWLERVGRSMWEDGINQTEFRVWPRRRIGGAVAQTTAASLHTLVSWEEHVLYQMLSKPPSVTSTTSLQFYLLYGGS